MKQQKEKVQLNKKLKEKKNKEWLEKVKNIGQNSLKFYLNQHLEFGKYK